MLIVGNDGQFRRFCAALGLNAATDPRFARNADRLAHADALHAMIAAALAMRSRAECLALLEAAGVPAAPINDLAEVFRDPQVVARGLVQQVGSTDVRVIGNPIRMSRSPLREARPAPRLDQHTEEVVEELAREDANGLP